MGRSAGRTPEATRRALIAAAADAIRRNGVHASLDLITREAGVSKGGLLYHFPSKDELVLAVAAADLDGFRRSVEERIDADDAEPGRRTRAYIRTVFASGADHVAVRDSTLLLQQLMTVPAVVDLAVAESARLTAELDDDGLPAHILTLVMAAADGVSAAPLWGATGREERHADLERRLLALTRDRDLWEALRPPS